MKIFYRKIMTLMVFLALIPCAGLQGCAGHVPRAPEGKALLLGDKTYIPGAQYRFNAMIRTVDGKETGTTMERPVYQAELVPGTHQIGAFCIESMGQMTKFGPAKEITIQVDAGHVYRLKQIPPSGNDICAFGGVEDVTPE